MQDELNVVIEVQTRANQLAEQPVCAQAFRRGAWGVLFPFSEDFKRRLGGVGNRGRGVEMDPTGAAVLHEMSVALPSDRDTCLLKMPR